MKIGTSPDLPLTDALSQKRNASVASRTADRRAERAADEDEVRLSQASRLLTTAGTNQSEAVRAEKVAEVRQAIREGRFHVNARFVAAKMVAEAAELLETLSRAE